MYNKSCTKILNKPNEIDINKPFKVPLRNYTPGSASRCLGLRRNSLSGPLHDPTAENALVLYSPPPLTNEEKLRLDRSNLKTHVVVDPLFSYILRPHQREGVKFMFDCVTGVQLSGYNGCIMADEMGLGKTLQCICLVWTLLKQGPDGPPLVNKVVIVTPSSLVKNWQKEFQKWLGDKLNVLAIDGGKSQLVDSYLEQFSSACYLNRRSTEPVLIISYETFRLHCGVISKANIGLLICDEGHRLKNCQNQIYTSLTNLSVQRRVLLSGTPIQNDLLEYFSLLNFINPGILGSALEFHKKFENPILRGRDSEACEADRANGDQKLAELIDTVSICIIRRTSNLLTHYLPVKREHVVCCALTDYQKEMYSSTVRSNRGAEEKVDALALITSLKKICNHPDLVKNGDYHLDVNLSGKFVVLENLLKTIKSISNDKMVLISNYTQTLDLFEKLCLKNGYSFIRLDGSLTSKKRSRLVDDFNSPHNDTFVFMLSSKAGGCGLNLVAANRLVMFDPDWNPANDDQAMARIWRDGQRKECFIYRLISTGTIEERILQRQAHKKALSDCVVDQEDVERHFSLDDLREIYMPVSSTCSDTHDKFNCKRCVRGIQHTLPGKETNCSCDLSNWNHCMDSKNVEDLVLKRVFSSLAGVITFVFWHHSHCKQRITV